MVKPVGWLIFGLGLLASGGYVFYANDLSGHPLLKVPLVEAAASYTLPDGSIYRASSGGLVYRPQPINLGSGDSPVRVTVSYAFFGDPFRPTTTYPALRLTVVDPSGQASPRGQIALTRPSAGNDNEFDASSSSFELLQVQHPGQHWLVIEQLPGAEIRTARQELEVRARATPLSMPVVIAGVAMMLFGVFLAVKP